MAEGPKEQWSQAEWDQWWAGKTGRRPGMNGNIPKKKRKIELPVGPFAKSKADAGPEAEADAGAKILVDLLLAVLVIGQHLLASHTLAFIK